MKKKLLAVVLSVVMIAALLVPMMAISADGAPTLTIGLGAPTLEDRFGDSVIKVPVLISENNGQVFAIRYQVVSKDGLVPYVNAEMWDNGYDDGDFTESFAGGRFTAKLANTVNNTLELEGNKGFQVVQDVTGAPAGNVGISTAAGTLINLYFVAPTAIGSYEFELIWMDGADNTTTKFVANVGAPVSYTVECKNHVAGDAVVTKKATCTEDGVKTTSCSVCGAEMDTEAIPATGHEWDGGVVAEGVKCGETADTTYTCKTCGATDVRTGAKVEHNMVADAANSKAATCTEAGATVTKCDREGCDYTESVAIPALGHDMIADEANSKAPTCTEAGADATKCSRCDYTESEAIEALGHDFTGEVVVVTVPTAEAEGKLTIACTECDAVEEIVLEKLATKVEYEIDGKVFVSFESAEAILPEDVMISIVEDAVEDENGKITEVWGFDSMIMDLEGTATFSVDTTIAGEYTDFTVKDAAGNDVEFTFENGILTFNADLTAEYTITYVEVKQSPVTADATNTVVYAVVALMTVAGLVVVGKKRFAL